MTPIRPIDPALLLGTWHVVATTLPFWRRNRDPQITYAAREDGRLLDTVTYKTASGTDKSIVGVDTPHGNGAFLWRGSGWLFWCTSRWCFVDAEGDWALTWFSAATFFVTPEGYDIYARDSRVDSAGIRKWLEAVEARAQKSIGSGWFLTTYGSRSDGGQPLR